MNCSKMAAMILSCFLREVAFRIASTTYSPFYYSMGFSLLQATKAQVLSKSTPHPFHDLGTQMGVGGQRQAPAALLQGKTRYPSYRRLDRSQGRSGRVRKISLPPGFDPRTVQPVASRYTYCAIRAHSTTIWIVLYLNTQPPGMNAGLPSISRSSFFSSSKSLTYCVDSLKEYIA